MLTTFTPFETEVDSDLQDRFFEWTERQGVTVHELTMVGWINADLAFTALLAAGPQFDRAEVVDAARSITELQRRQPDRVDRLEPPAQRPRHRARGPTRWSAAPSSGARAAQFVPYSGEDGKPWLCWESEEDEFTEPEVVGDFG